MTLPRPLLRLWRWAVLLCALGLANVSLGQTVSWDGGSGLEGLSLTLVQTTYWEQDGTPFADFEVQAPAGDDPLDATLYVSHDLTINGFDDSVPGSGEGNWFGVSPTRLPLSITLLAGTATISVTGPGSTASSFTVNTGGGCDSVGVPTADRVTIADCAYPENGHVPTTLGIGTYEHVVSSVSGVSVTVQLRYGNGNSFHRISFDRFPNPTPATLTVSPRHGAVSNVTQSLSVASSPSAGGTTTVTLDVGFDYTENGPATQANTLGIDVRDVSVVLMDAAGMAHASASIAGTCNETGTSAGTADIESASCAAEAGLAIPSTLPIGRYTLRVADETAAEDSHSIGFSVNGVPYRAAVGADPFVAPSAASVLVDVMAHTATVAVGQVEVAFDQAFVGSRDGSPVTDFDLQAPTGDAPDLNLTLRVRNSFTLAPETGADPIDTVTNPGMQSSATPAQAEATLRLTRPDGTTLLFHQHTHINGAFCSAVSSSAPFGFSCEWPGPGFEPHHTDIGTYRYDVLRVAPESIMVVTVNGNPVTVRLDEVASTPPLTINVSPRHGSVTPAASFGPVRTAYFLDEGAASVALSVGFDYQEEGAATQATVLGIDILDATVTVLGSDGTTLLTETLNEACRQQISNSGRTDLETASCVLGVGVPFAAGLPTGTLTVTAAAGGLQEGQGRYQLLVNDVPYRATDGANPYTATPAVSSTLVIEEDTVPTVVSDTSPLVFVQDVTATIEAPVVEGGNGDVTIDYAVTYTELVPLSGEVVSTGIPGMVLTMSDGSWSGTGTPTRAGDYTLTVTATDSDNDIDPARSDDSSATEIEIEVVAATGTAVSLASAQLGAAEGGTVDVVVHATPAAQADFTVPYSLTTDADAGTTDAEPADYEDVGAGSLVIPAGSARGTIQLSLQTDTQDEGDEVFLIVLGTPTSSGTAPTLGTLTTATVTIGEPVTLSLTGDAEVVEGGVALYTVSLAGGATAAADMTVRLEGARLTTDLVDFRIVDRDVTIRMGESSATARVVAVGDDEFEATERFRVSLGDVRGGGPGGGTVSPTANQIDTSILDGDSVVSFLEPVCPAVEGDGGTTVSLALGAPAPGRITVPLMTLSVGGAGDEGHTAATPGDYAIMPGNAVFEAGATVATVVVTATNDTDRDPNERIRLGFGTLPGLLDAGQASVAVVDLVDNHVTINLAHRFSIAEDVGTTTFTVRASGDAYARCGPVEGPPGAGGVAATQRVLPTEDVTVTVTSGGVGAASSGSDHVAIAPTHTLSAGMAMTTFTVEIIDDTVPEFTRNEAHEILRLTLSELQGGGSERRVTLDTMPLDVRITDNDGPLFSGAATRTMDEGTVEEWIVALPERLAPGAETASITITVAPLNSESTSADYRSTPTSVVFMSNRTLATVTMTARVDGVNDDGAMFSVGFSNAGEPRVDAGAHASVTWVIRDRPVSLRLEPAGRMFDEVGDAGPNALTMVAEIGDTLTADLPVTLSVAPGGSATRGDDYDVRLPALTITAGETLATVTGTLTLFDDDIAEGLETIAIAGDAADHRIVRLDVPLVDGDQAVATLSLRHIGQGPVSEGGTAEFEVALMGNVGSGVIVPWSLSNTGSADGDDVALASGAVRFAAEDFLVSSGGDEVTRTVTVSVTADGIAEPEERLVLELESPAVPDNPALADLIGMGDTVAEVGIAANETVTLSLTVAEAVDEGAVLSAEVSVEGDLPRADPITLDVSVLPGDQGHMHPADVTLEVMENTVAIPVTVGSDADSEPGELSLEVTRRAAPMTPLVPVEIVDPSRQVEIRDYAEIVTVAFETVATTAVEGNPDSVNVLGPRASVWIALDRPSRETVVITVTVDPFGGAEPAVQDPDTGVVSGDYFIGRTVELAPGETRGRVVVLNAGDDLAESGEWLRLGFGDLPSGVVTGTVASTASVALADRAVILSATPRPAAEPVDNMAANDLPVTVTASLAGAARGENVTVTLNLDGPGSTAEAGPDYVAASPLTAVITAGDLTGTATFAVKGDDVVELNERIVIGGSIPSGEPVVDTTVTIQDNADDTVTLTVTPVAGAAEGGRARFDVSLGPVGTDTYIDWDLATLPGGLEVDEVSPASGRVILTASATGMRDATPILLDIADDDLSEGMEEVAIRVRNASFGEAFQLVSRITITAVTVTATVEASDPLELTLSGPTAALEGRPPSYRVDVLGGTPTEDITVTVTVTDVDTTAGTDYTAPANVTIPAGQRVATFTVGLVDDSVNEPDEAFSVTVSATGGGGGGLAVSAGSEVETTIIDDDHTVSFGSATYTVEEGGSATAVSLTLGRVPGRPVTVLLAAEPAQGDGASLADDLAAAIPASLVFASDEQTVSFDVTAVDDRFNDDDETFRLSLDVSGVGFVGEGANPTAILSVTDDDSATPNADPAFASPFARVFQVSEATLPGTEFGTVLMASDGNGDDISYSLSGDAELFGISAGQLSVARGATLDFETATVHILTVGISDGLDDMSAPDTVIDASVVVTVSVQNAAEAPPAPRPPRVAWPTDDAMMTITWDPPAGSDSAISDYDVQYRPDAPGGAWTNVLHTGTGTRAVVASGLDADTRYRVRVRATSPEGTGPWSDDGLSARPRGVVDRSILLSASTLALTEGATQPMVTITASLGAPTGEDLMLTLAADEGTALSPGDYTVPAIEVMTINAGDREAEVTLEFATPTDDVVELHKSFSIRVSRGAEIYTVNTLDFAVLDDDTAEVTISPDSAMVAESVGSVGVGITVSHEFETALTFTLTTSAGTAINGTDFTASAAVDFGADSAAGASESVDIAVTDDDLAEVDETFTLTIAGLHPDFAGRVLLMSSPEVTILANDPLGLSLTGPGRVMEDAGMATYALSVVDHTSSADVTVSVTAATPDTTAQETDDYVAPTSPLTIAAGVASLEFNVEIVDDSDPDDGELLVLELSSPSGGGGDVSIVAPGRVTTTIEDDERIVLSVPPEALTEGGGPQTVAVTAQVEGVDMLANQLLLTLGVRDGTAESPGDYTASPIGTITIAADAVMGEADVVITPFDDPIVEDAETFSVFIAGGAGGFASNEAAVTLSDADEATLSIEGPLARVDEGDSAEFTVTLSHQVDAQVTVTLDVTDGGADAAADLSHDTPATVVFAPNLPAGAERTFQVTAVDDNLPEAREDFTVSIGARTPDFDGRIAASATGQDAVATIEASDQLMLSISPPARGADEGQALTFDVSADGTLPDDLEIGFTTGGSATSGSDFTAPTSPVTLMMGGASGRIILPVLDDSTMEDMFETVEVTISVAEGLAAYVPPANSAATGTIFGDDSLFRLSTNLDRVAETDMPMTLTITGTVVDGRARTTVTNARLLLTGNATQGSDYVLLDPGDRSQTLSVLPTMEIAAGEISGTVSVLLDPLDDNMVEVVETIGIDASYSGSRIDRATITLTSDDNTTLSITASSVTVDESARRVRFTATMTPPIAGTTVTFTIETVDGTALSGQDYTAATGTITLRPGTESPFTVTLVSDSLVEPAEDFSVSVSGVRSVLGDSVVVGDLPTVTIAASDPPTVVLAPGVGPRRVEEGDGIVTFALGLARNVTTGADISVTFTIDAGSTAAEGRDYEALVSPLVISAGQSRAELEVTIIDDFLDGLSSDDERERETLTIVMTSATFTGGEAVMIRPVPPTNFTLTIDDDDDPPAVAEINRLPPMLAEGESVTATVTLSSREIDGPAVNIPIEVDLTGGAVAADYSVTPETLTFTMGQREATFTLAAVDDSDDDDGEVLGVRFGDLPVSVVAGDRSSVEVEIIDGDGVSDPTIALGADVTEVAEDAGMAVVTVTATRSGGRYLRNDLPVTVLFASAGSADADDHDDTVALPTVTIAAGASGGTSTFTLTVTPDDRVEGDETVVLTAFVPGHDDHGGTITITDDDTAVLSLSGPTETLAEGAAAAFTLTLSRPVDASLTVSVEIADGSAVADEDFTGDSRELPMLGVQSVAFNIPIVNDNRAEGVETFTVSIAGVDSALADRISTVGVDVVTVTIGIDDLITLSLVGPGRVGEDAGDVEYTVRLDGTSTERTEVSVRIADASAATAPEDYQTPSSPLTITAGVSSVTFTIAVVDDPDDDNEETMIVELFDPSGGGAGPGGVVFAPASASVTTTITDNDEVVLVLLQRASRTVLEGGRATVVLSVSGDREHPVSVAYAITGPASLPDDTEDDYTDPGNGVLMIPRSAREGTITIDVPDDDDAELGVRLSVEIESAGFGVDTDDVIMPAGPTVATIDIQGSDAVVLSLAPPRSPEVVEGETASFRINKTAFPSDVPITVQVLTSERGTATNGTDYMVPVSVTVPAGSFSGRFVVRTEPDDESDPDETLVISLGDRIPETGVLVDPATFTLTVVERNFPPTFGVGGGTVARSVPENTPAGAAVGAPVAASDPDGGDTLVYSLGDDDPMLFGIGADGQITVAAGTTLDHESDTVAYTVVVSVHDGKDSRGHPDSTTDEEVTVLINVSDVAEPPPAPAAPAVGPAAVEGHLTLTVGWTAPAAAGIPPVTAYDIEHRLAGAPDSDFTGTNIEHSGTDTSATVTGLVPGTAYQVRVRARNDEGVGEWSPVGAGATGAGYVVSVAEPSIGVIEGETASVTVEVGTAAPTALSVGYEVRESGAAVGTDFTNPGGGSLTISSRASFGVIEFPVTEENDAEAEEGFVVVLTAVSQVGTTPNLAVLGTDTETSVSIPANDAIVLMLEGPTPPDVDEGTAAGFTVHVSGGNNTVALTVALSVGGSADPATDYTAPPGSVTVAAGATSVRFSVPITPESPAIADPGETIIVALVSPTVATPAFIADETAVTVTIVEANAAPSFAGTPGVALVRSVPENSPAGTRVGAPVQATDTDSAVADLVYSLGPGDPLATVAVGSLFGIDGSGQITVAAGATLDHEMAAVHTVAVAVHDGFDARGFPDTTPDGTATVVISVVDVDEVPSAPTALSVGPAAVDGHVTLAADWVLPDTTGIPPIDNVVLEYRENVGGAEVRTVDVGIGSSGSIPDLVPGTEYVVRVRASNAEGAGGWSAPVLAGTGTGVVVSMASSSLTGAEGGTVRVSVLMAPRQSTSVTAFLDIRDEGAVGDQDYTGPDSQSIVIRGGATRGSATFSLVDDVLAEESEVFVVSLVSVTLDGVRANRALVGTPAETSVTIRASDGIVVSLSSQETTVAVGGTATVLVSVVGGIPAEVVDVSLALDGGSASATLDYVQPMEPLVLDPLALTGTVEITVQSAATPGREIEIALTRASGGGGPSIVADRSVVTLTITDENDPPGFDQSTVTVTVTENTAAGGNVGAAVTATDPDSHPLAYSLSGADASLFGIGEGTGQLTVATGATLDHEARDSHTVVVSARDNRDDIGAADTSVDASVTVVVEVSDVDEPPVAPMLLSVSPASVDGHRRLVATWEVPPGAGRPPVTGYEVEWKPGAAAAYVRVPHVGTATTATISGLVPGVAHDVRVRARNDEGTGPPASATGTTGDGFVVSMAAATLEVRETAGNADVIVRRAASTAPAADITATYRVRSLGAIEGVDYTVPGRTVTIGSAATSATISIPILVDAVAEVDDVFVVELADLESSGSPAILGAATETTVTILAHGAAALSLTAPRTAEVGTTVTGTVEFSGEPRTADVSVSVSVDGTALTNSPRVGRPTDNLVTFHVPVSGAAVPGTEISVEIDAAPPALISRANATILVVDPNTDPVFAVPGVLTFTVSEDAGPGDPVGSPIAVTDDVADTLSYSLSGSGGLFGISGSGQVTVAAGATLDFETEMLHTVVAGVGDGKDTLGIADGRIDITREVVVTVTDVPEPPAAPAAPAVATAAVGGDTALSVGWDAPDTTGIPRITGYDIEHRWKEDDTTGPFTSGGVSHSGALTMALIRGLDPGTEYEVRVRARNAEGAGPWSDTTAGVTDGGVDLDADANGVVEARDGLYLFYTFQFGGILRRDPGLRDIVFDNLASRTRPPERTNIEILEHAEALDESEATEFDIDANGTVEARDALFAFYTWQFGGILSRDPGLRDIVFDNLADRARPPGRTNEQILNYARLLTTPLE